MNVTAHDTLKIAKELAAAGFEEKKAQALAEQFGELANEHFVTKEYLDFKLKELKYQMMFGLGGLMVAVLTFFELVSRFFGS